MIYIHFHNVNELAAAYALQNRQIPDLLYIGIRDL